MEIRLLKKSNSLIKLETRIWSTYHPLAIGVLLFVFPVAIASAESDSKDANDLRSLVDDIFSVSVEISGRKEVPDALLAQFSEKFERVAPLKKKNENNCGHSKSSPSCDALTYMNGRALPAIDLVIKRTEELKRENQDPDRLEICGNRKVIDGAKAKAAHDLVALKTSDKESAEAIRGISDDIVAESHGKIDTALKSYLKSHGHAFDMKSCP